MVNLFSVQLLAVSCYRESKVPIKGLALHIYSDNLFYTLFKNIQDISVMIDKN